MEEMPTGSVWAGDPTREHGGERTGEVGSWFPLNNRHIQTDHQRGIGPGLAQPLASRKMLASYGQGDRVNGVWARLLSQGGLSSHGHWVQIPSQCRPVGSSSPGTKKPLLQLPPHGPQSPQLSNGEVV